MSKTLAKMAMRQLATTAVLPEVASFRLRAAVMGRDRALQGSTQSLALLPGVAGQYLRAAFLREALEYCHPEVCISYGVLFSKAGARIDENVYVGPNCQLGLVHLERDVLVAAGVHIPSGARIHGTDDPDVPIREQPGEVTLVRIGAGAWIGSGAVVMAHVGRNTIVAAGSVVTRPLPDGVVAAGAPARVLRQRSGESATPLIREAK